MPSKDTVNTKQYSRTQPGLNLKMRVSPTGSAVKAGRNSLSGVDPSVGKNAETAPKAVKSLQGPQLESFWRESQPTACRWLVGAAGVCLHGSLPSARQVCTPDSWFWQPDTNRHWTETAPERSLEYTGVNSVIFLFILWCLPAKWPPVRFLSCIFDKQEISREWMQTFGQMRHLFWDGGRVNK